MQTAKVLPAGAPQRELRHLDQHAQDRLADLGTTVMPMRTLRRTGRRPYTFNGETLVTVCGITPALPFWYELNVHRTVIDTYVSDIRLFHKTPDLADLFWVAEHDDVEEVTAHFERYDPTGDVTPPREMTRAGSIAELALWTARLQMQVDGITQHFRTQAGELLHALSTKG